MILNPNGTFSYSWKKHFCFVGTIITTWRDRRNVSLMLFGSVVSTSLQKPFYVVIIDADSTGSRVFAFNFHISNMNGDLILDSELFHAIKPGLSSYADKPSDGIKSLETLLEKTEAAIPQSEWAHIFMKATAGLRLLPEHNANAILEECRKFLKTCGF